ncbi:ABC transporter ATP-binding protein (plasmid) [Sinorhizobium meliloti WSM1022]|uniref:ATP-binding cassette domain-containing protein n=1 Tax=Rhizobium meliloti TaxID=382 RepID=A0AAW9TPU5_RHIML|nr:ABC transporter ATP-binding protein [Sinorhizobium meliloti]AGA11508.1 ABC-type nitrate/sulfonate/bicarbonate transport system, ATPase component [Sinorhizobium meliloti GR4]MCM5692921.1 ABC transporter ATP-binding protein [Sinorhizobium meliloti]MDW9389791.1 ATP-binding cassette domain-containing protein [Sinorhizobium meliloti]MDW9624776.1 ATP-binding cassette domain-containing protein [Sinorhizobium meliloti]MDW9995485.1 ATP-binding cassette domain-containing protein [Sinorhizobium melilo
MIRIDVRRKAFGEEEVLRDIRFEMEIGETVAILGPSGVGKSTLLRLVAGIDTAFEGEITRPENIAMVFQEPVLLPWRSVIENLTLVHPQLGAQAALSALERTGIADRAGLFPGQLSLGQQRRLALARAFAGRPELLVLDEPYVSLDPAMAEDMLALTEALIAETAPAVILVTHSEAEARRLARRCLRLAGKPATIIEEFAAAPGRAS